MGVPAFFRKLITKYKVLSDNIDGKIDVFYIDANCLFHPQCFKVLDENKNLKDQDKLFTKMKDSIIEYIEYLIKEANPRRLVYLAVDGVAPLAKIKQQRIRRFGNSHNYKHEIYRKYNIEFNDSWSNIVITPGTDFMIKLHNEIIKHFSDKTIKRKYKLIYSPYLVSGEGEHKILQHIKNNKYKNSIVIYGLDADLIFLSLASHVNKIYLMREKNQISDNKSEDLNYVNIDLVRQYICDDFANEYNKYTMSHINNDFVNDYIFVCFFLGNDFLPHLPSIDIDIHGLEILLNSYMDTFKKLGEHVINDKINYDFLIEFLGILSSKEEDFFKYSLPEHMKGHSHKKCRESEKHKIDIWNIENLKNMTIDDTIRLGQGKTQDWKYRYYNYYFGIEEYYDISVDEICENYMEGISWMVKYYFDKCPSWRWQYKYTHAPFISDVLSYVKRHKKNISFVSDKSVNIYSQLLSVIPPSYSHILPKEIQYLNSSYKSPIIDMYPSCYKIDMINKTKLYKCVPLIPYLDIDRIEKNIPKNLQVTENNQDIVL